MKNLVTDGELQPNQTNYVKAGPLEERKWYKVAEANVKELPFYTKQGLVPSVRKMYYRHVELGNLEKCKSDYDRLCRVAAEQRKGIDCTYTKSTVYPRLPIDCFRDEKRVTSPSEAISEFYKARFLDCKINAYPDYTDALRKGLHQAVTYGGRSVVPSFLFIDMDKGAFIGNLDLLTKALMKTLDNINTKFHGIFKPTILWSGNGYHIYLPVRLEGPSWCLAHTDVFNEFSREPDRKFIQWAEQYLSDGKADPCHSKGLSFKNCLVRSPGSYNSKNNCQVRIIQHWDGQRPYLNWILRDFRRYLIQKKIKPEKKRATEVYSTNWDKGWSTAAG